MIEVRGLTHRYRRLVALDDVTFDVRPGEIVALLGGNGAGKSTLLRCLLGISPYEGIVRVDGLDPLADGRRVRARIGYLPQACGLHLDLTVGETVRLYAGLRGVAPETARGPLAQMELAGRLDDPVGELSGGLRQRLGLVLARLGDPPVLLLDEPAASLDRAGRGLLSAALVALAREGRTVLFSTHTRDELLAVAHRSLSLEDGRLVASPAALGRPSGAAAEARVAAAGGGP